MLHLWSREVNGFTHEDPGVRAAVARGALCILFASGQLSCSGRNEVGQAGQGTMGETAPPAPVSVAGVSGWSAVAGWALGTCALSTVGDVWCWGDNAFGAMGIDPQTATVVPEPRLVMPHDPSDPVEEIHIGNHMGCVLRQSRGVECWGGEPPNDFDLAGEPLDLRAAAGF